MHLLSGDILITGASSGIGREMAFKLAKTAKSLVLVARRTQRLQEVANRCREINSALNIQVISCDLANSSSIQKLLQQIEEQKISVTVLINNAGLGDIGLFESIDSNKMETLLMVNVVGLTILTRGLIPKIMKAERGGILNVSSGYGLTWLPFNAVYVGSKHYVSGFNVSLRTELAGTGITVSQLCPGPVATEFMSIAGNPFGVPVPSWIEISPERCAQIGLRGFARGREIIIPGFVMWCAINLGRIVPRFILRFVYAFIARLLRRRLRQEALQSSKEEKG